MSKMRIQSLSSLILTIGISLFATLTCFSNDSRSATASPILCQEYASPKNISKLYASDNPVNFYFLDEDGNLNSKSLTTRMTNWSYEVGGNSESALSADEKLVYFTNISENTENSVNEMAASVGALSKATGVPAWRSEKLAVARKNNPNTRPRTFLYQQENNLLYVNSEGLAALIDKSSGEIRWKINFSAPISADPVLVRDQLIFSDDERRLHFLDLNLGQISRTIKLRQRAAAIYADNRQIIVGDQKGSVEALDRKTGNLLWSFKTGGAISGIVEIFDGFLITSFDNFVYAVAKENGDLLWKKRFSSRLREKPSIDSTKSIAVLIDGRRALFLDLAAKGLILSGVELTEDETFSDSPIIIKDLYILSAATKILVYSSKACPAIN